jgi:hypothetical protein
MTTIRFLGARHMFISLKMKGQNMLQRHDSVSLLAMNWMSLGIISSILFQGKL